MKAIWNKQVITESDDIIIVEGNSYFPLEVLNREFVKESETEIVCHWKGPASYYSLEAGGATNKDAAF